MIKAFVDLESYSLSLPSWGYAGEGEAPQLRRRRQGQNTL
jgi:hypothetical protein